MGQEEYIKHQIIHKYIYKDNKINHPQIRMYTSMVDQHNNNITIYKINQAES